MKKILLIEDEKILSEMYETRLKREGFEVINTRDAEGGLELIKKEKPDLILLDLLLPGMQGQEALRILKEDPKTKDIPIIIFSNYDTPEVRKEAEKYGVRYILKANVTTRDLVELVKREIGEKK
ncbi:MAG: response regulator [Parcubacteria group bacterium CG07_land_8_20_14_0_80_35_11]|nr:MAG: response regulator [Parcubacteria group bacterium CG07_land_8_20_14_0_80_35_11]